MKKKYNIRKLTKNFFSIIKLFGLSKIFLLSFLIIIVMLLEVLSIGLIIPIISVLENENYLNQFSQHFVFLKNLTHLEQIISIIILLCSVFFIKFIFLIFVNYQQFKYSMFLQSEISNKLINKYLMMSYESYFQVKSSEILRNIKEDAGNFVHGVLIPVINITTELLVIIGIAILLVSQIGIFSFSIILLFIIFCISYIKLSRKTILQLGNQRFLLDEKIINASNETFSGIREIKVNSVENYFLMFFKKLFEKNAKNVRKFLTFQVIPRLSIELLLVIFLSIMMFFLIIKGVSFAKVISILGLFSVAAIRLIPSTNKIMLSQQNIRFYFVSIDNLARELNYSKKNITKKKIINFSSLIELKKIGFSYSKKDPYILRDFNFSIKKGEKIGIIGKSGSGKSTFVDILSGLLTSFDGSYLVDFKPINFNKYTWGRKIGYVSQNTFIFNDTIKFNISFDNKKKNSEIFEVLKTVEMLKFVKKQKNSLNSPVGENAIKLSGGQIQRLGIARSIFFKPDILILDEAFSGIDNSTEKKILKNVLKLYKNMTIINIAHKGKSLDYCDSIYKILNKKLKKVK